MMAGTSRFSEDTFEKRGFQLGKQNEEVFLMQRQILCCNIFAIFRRIVDVPISKSTTPTQRHEDSPYLDLA